MPTHACIDGTESDNSSWWEHDYRGIPLCRVCDDCRETKLMVCNKPIGLNDSILDGAKWAKRSLPFDPFAVRHPCSLDL